MFLVFSVVVLLGLKIDNVNDNLKVLIFNVHFRNVYLAIY